MTLLRTTSTKPGTHALVIGVGRYPWLVGGKRKPTFPENDGMAQLTSPPASARAFATWLLDNYENPESPLASVDLLLSDSKSQTFKIGRKNVEVDPATFAHVAPAIRAWATRGARPDDLLLFFFSGHGVLAGYQTTLLLEEFGSDPLAALSHAIDFTRLHTALDRVASRRQCFFVDACRVATTTVLETFGQYGQSVLDPKANANPQPRQAPIFQSTLAGQQAYGRKGRPSYFTEALLRGFTGAATDDEDDGLTWWVQTDALLKALPPLLRRVVDKPGLILPQAPASDVSRFPLHRLKKAPTGIPVDVSCNPDEHTAGAILTCTGAGTNAKRKVPSAKTWQLDLAEGSYTFAAEVKSPAGEGSRTDPIRPHYRNIKIKIRV